jgi:hypothetical protein
MISSQPQSKYQIAMKASSQHLKVEVHKQTTMDHTTIKLTNHNSNINIHGYWQQPKVFNYSTLALVCFCLSL